MVDGTVTRFNHNEKIIEVGDIMITSVRVLLVGVFLLLLYLDDVMSCVVTHIEAVKHLNVTTISTADHIPAHIEDHSK